VVAEALHPATAADIARIAEALAAATGGRDAALLTRDAPEVTIESDSSMSADEGRYPRCASSP